MNKERLVAFTDAILAIIMTILVLALERPSEPTLQAFWALRNSYLAYALSFFWLGSLWMGLNEVWDSARHIDNATVLWTLVLLFLASLIPYATDLVSYYFESRIVQCGYGLTPCQSAKRLAASALYLAPLPPLTNGSMEIPPRGANLPMTSMYLGFSSRTRSS